MDVNNNGFSFQALLLKEQIDLIYEVNRSDVIQHTPMFFFKQPYFL